MRKFLMQAVYAVLVFLTVALSSASLTAVGVGDCGFEDQEEGTRVGWVVPGASSARPAKEERPRSSGRRFLRIEPLETSANQPLSPPFTKSGKGFVNLLRVSRK